MFLFLVLFRDAIMLSDDEALRLHSEPRTSQTSSPSSTKSTSNNPGESKQSTSEKSPYRYVSSITSSMNVYIQMLVSHVLQPGILAAMMESKGWFDRQSRCRLFFFNSIFNNNNNMLTSIISMDIQDLA